MVSKRFKCGLVKAAMPITEDDPLECFGDTLRAGFASHEPFSRLPSLKNSKPRHQSQEFQQSAAALPLSSALRHSCRFHQAMATPTFFIPPPSLEEIAERLEREVRRQQEATPEPVFQRPEVTQSYDYLCEIEHKRFTPEEVDLFRSSIA
jgi:hypothetical protein